MVLTGAAFYHKVRYAYSMYNPHIIWFLFLLVMVFLSGPFLIVLFVSLFVLATSSYSGVSGF